MTLSPRTRTHIWGLFAERVSAPNDIGENRVAPGSVSALVVAYYQSGEFRTLKPQTQANYRNILDRFRAEYGAKPAKLLEARHIKAILDGRSETPGAASNLLKRLRNLFSFAADRGFVPRDPTIGVRFKKPKTDGFRAWTDDDIDRFLRNWGEGTRARLALTLLLYTGQRRSDVVRMGRQHVRAGPKGAEAIFVRQKKTDTELLIPVHPTLQVVLRTLPASNLTFLVTEGGKPFSEAGFTNWFVQCARDAGLPPNSTPHGLRKAAGRKLAEAGCSALEIGAITGHSSLREVERYTKSARQATLAQAAMGRIVNIGSQTRASNRS